MEIKMKTRLVTDRLVGELYRSMECLVGSDGLRVPLSSLWKVPVGIQARPVEVTDRA